MPCRALPTSSPLADSPTGALPSPERLRVPELRAGCGASRGCPVGPLTLVLFAWVVHGGHAVGAVDSRRSLEPTMTSTGQSTCGSGPQKPSASCRRLFGAVQWQRHRTGVRSAATRDTA